MQCAHCFQEINTDGVCPYCGYDSSATAGKYPLALKPGSILNGRYILGHVLGQGGFGITYIAWDDQTGERVAIKEYLPTDFAGRSTGSPSVLVYSGDRAESFAYGKAQYLEEAKTLAALIGIPGIVRIYSYFEENNTAYFCMEYVDGLPLNKYMATRGGRLSPEEAASLLLPLTQSLAAVHAKGIVHRDIAPDNILVTKDGRAKLIDFGAARYSTGEKSKSLDVILKHGFAPAEQYMHRGRQGPWTDVYALGATWYYAITGKVPQDALERMDNDALQRPSAAGAKIDEAEEQVLLRAMSVFADDRFQNMGEFSWAMEAASEPQHREKELRRGQARREELKQPAQEHRVEERQESAARESAAREEKERLKREGKTRREREKRDAELLKQEEKERRGREKAAVHEAKQQAAGNRPKPRLALYLGTVAVLAAVLFFVFADKGQREAPEASATPEAETVQLAFTPPPVETEEAVNEEELRMETAYAEAEALLQDEEAMKAFAAFRALGDYRDAAERAQNIAYEIRLSKSVPLDSGSHTIGLKRDGTVIATQNLTRKNYASNDLLNDDAFQRDIAKWTDVVSVLAEGYGLRKDGTVLLAGNDKLSADKKIERWTDIVAISTSTHTVGLKADGTVVATAYVEKGQCKVSGWTDIVSITAGEWITIGVKADGTLVTAGDIGQHSNIYTWTDIVSVAAGETIGHQIIGLKSDGTVVASGENRHGECNVSDWTDIVAVAVGMGYTVGLKSDGTVVVAGRGSYGAHKVTDWTDIVSIAADTSNTVGLKSDGTVVAVGYAKDGACDVSDWTDIGVPE
ncbi:MAG: protein kinase [Oscillospiraceae bacterium]|nr:protein kinase [Oscillospiraceae bacterium]